jgi:hypothetical protein
MRWPGSLGDADCQSLRSMPLAPSGQGTYQVKSILGRLLRTCTGLY